MVLAAFNPLYAAAATATAVYQPREQRFAMQSYYQQHVYGSRSYAAAFGNSGAASGQDQFYTSINGNLCPTAYGYGQQQPSNSFPSSPSQIASFKNEQSFQQQTSGSDAQSIGDNDRMRSDGPTTMPNAVQSTNKTYATAGQQSQPSITAASTFAPCRVYPNESKVESMESRISPPNYFYATSSSMNAQSCYGVASPTSGFSFANANPTPPAFAFGCPSHFGESGQLPSEYPWMKSKFQAQIPYSSNHATMGSAFPMEIGWCNNPSPGRTRTREKYRMVYTDGQRLELEKEFITSEYISTQRKSYLSRALGLSERQIKIWFQNRRAKKRKQSRRTTVGATNSIAGQSQTRPMVSSTSDFNALPSLTSANVSEDGETRQQVF